MAPSAREAAGAAAAELVTPGMVLGLGTGDTAACFIRALARRVAVEPALRTLRCVATSTRSAQLGSELGLAIVDLDALAVRAEHAIDLTVDGADEIDPQLQLVKGAGGALLFEKLVATASKELVVVADRGKQVAVLGEKRLLPVEIVAFGAQHTLARLRRQPGITSAALRQGSAGPYLTDGGHLIVDLGFALSPELSAAQLHERLKALPGVVETGFFLHEAKRVLIGQDDGSVAAQVRP